MAAAVPTLFTPKNFAPIHFFSPQITLTDGIENSIPLLHETASFRLDWESSDPMSGNVAEHVPSGNFVEKFTDLLLSTSSGDRNFSEDGRESDNSGGGGEGVDGGGDYYEGNKNYWNSILNLVNSSPSDDSPVF